MKMPSASKRRAFTLLEIMLVVAIIAMLLSAAFMALGDNIGFARDVRARGDIQTYETQLRSYEAAAGFYPTTEQGLDALVHPPQSEPKPARWYPFASRYTKDPWGNDYVYVQPGIKNPKGFDLYSKGKDKIANTEDDIWNVEEKK